VRGRPFVSSVARQLKRRNQKSGIPAANIPDIQGKLGQALDAFGRLEEVAEQVEAVNRALKGVNEIVVGVNDTRRLVAESLETNIALQHELARSRYVTRKLICLVENCLRPRPSKAAELTLEKVSLNLESALRDEYDAVCVLIVFFGRFTKG
jgi:DNA-binding FrmR family transcriptional regulator